MTVPNKVPYKEYISKGLKVYDIPFAFLNSQDIAVGVTVPYSYRISYMEEGADYSVTKVNETGHITLTISGLKKATKDSIVTVMRNPSFSQETRLYEAEAFYAETIERTFDSLVHQTQYLKMMLERTVTRPHGVKRKIEWDDLIKSVDTMEKALKISETAEDTSIKANSNSESALDISKKALSISESAKIKAEEATSFALAGGIHIKGGYPLNVTIKEKEAFIGLEGAVNEAKKLTTPRNINSVSFDGTKDITIKAEANGGNADIADKLKTPRKINGVAFDGTKDITIKAEANGGNADTADKLQTPCKINGVAFDGTRDITLGSGLSLSSDSYIDLSNDSITPYAGLIVMSTYGSGDVRLLFNGIEVGLTREGSETLGLYAGEKTRITFVSWGAIRVLSLRLYKIY